MVIEKALSTKENLLTVILVIWKKINKEYCFNLVTFIQERIKAAIKVWRGD